MALRLSIILLLLCMAHAASENVTNTASWGMINGSDVGTHCCFEGECFDEVPSLEEEISRRVLYGEGRRYISYDSLKKDSVPCNERGQSYYNCEQRSQVNPYRRGCSVVTRCARDLK